MPSGFLKRSKTATSKAARSKILPKLSKEQLGNLVPRRGSKIVPVIASGLLKAMGWRNIGEIPNVSQAVVFSQLLSWIGGIPINRENKGSVLQASIDKFKTGEPLFLGLAPKNTHQYTESWLLLFGTGCWCPHFTSRPRLQNQRGAVFVAGLS